MGLCWSSIGVWRGYMHRVLGDYPNHREFNGKVKRKWKLGVYSGF